MAIEKLNKLEKIVLDKIDVLTTTKWLRIFRKFILKYEAYLLRRSLEKKRDDKLKTIPHKNSSNIVTSILNNQIESLVQNVHLPNFNIEKIDFCMNTCIKMVDSYLLLTDLVGIQPLSGPVGLGYHLAYSGSENENISLNVLSVPIEAKSRKTNASWSIESMQDMNALHHDLDIKQEISNALASEIGTEIVDYTLNKLISLAETSELLSDIDLTNKTPKELAQYILIEINRAANQIAFKSRRGRGNYIIISPIMFSILQSLKNITDIPQEFTFSSYGLTYAGILEDRYKMFVSMQEPFALGKIFVGYKGTNNQCDTPYILSPYVPIIPTGIVVNPITYSAGEQFITRFGEYVVENENNITTAKNYFRILDLSNVVIKAS